MNFKGVVNRYDDKSTLWFVLVIFTAIQLLLFWSSQKKSTSAYNFKNTDVQKTITLFTLIYVSLLLMGVLFMMIKKTQNPLFDASWLGYTVVFTTLLYLIKIVSFMYKNIRS
jgi:ACR3 family arsenite efflux pump ArsB